MPEQGSAYEHGRRLTRPRAAVVGLTLALVMMMAVSGCTRFHDGSMQAAAPARAEVEDTPDAPQATEPSREARAEGERTVRFRRGAGDAGARRMADARSRGGVAMGLFGDLSDVPRESPGMANDGTDNLRRITYTREGADFDPAVDPSGEFLVFASTRHRQTEALYRKRVDGNTVTQLTDSAARDVMPVFSPDGERIAFASDRSGTWDIYVMSADGGRAVQVTDDRRHNIHPSFSPDGRRLVYASFGGPAQRWEMVVVDLDQPGTRQYLGPGLFPRWSPVDERILFQRARERGSRWFSVWAIELDERGEAGSPTEIAASTNAAAITPGWGPDGEHIVFCTVVDPGADEQQGDRLTQADVWVVRADGNGRARLTGGEYANLQPTWASDGTIYFVSDRSGEGAENIWALRPDEAVRLAAPERGGGSDGASARVDME